MEETLNTLNNYFPQENNNLYEISTPQEVPLSTTTDLLNNKRKHAGGRPSSAVWSYFTKGDEKTKGHYEATCVYCNQKWDRAYPGRLEVHLANQCIEVEREVRKNFLEIVARKNNIIELDDNKTKKLKTKNSNSQKNMEEYFDNMKLSEQKKNLINKSLAKFISCCGIQFGIVENPFFIDFVKNLKPSYDLPSRIKLKENLIEEEVANINVKITNELEKTNNLTLSE
jgi:hypothetical protein